MKKSLFTLLLLLFVSLTSHAQDNPQAMIVFDASGSMWGQIDGKAKITIAKKALNKVVSDWDENVHLGLIAYGHRKKGDCNDIQVLSPIGPINKSGMISKVKAIKPKGKTPISRSIKMAAEALKYTEEKATVILISDGKETCDADPCATAKSLESDGIDFVAHVIGFNVDKQTDAQLKCIADSTGGEYFSAKDASALNDAMGKIVKKVKEPEPPKPPVVKKLKFNLEITATEEEGGKWVEANHFIYKADDKEGDYIEACTSYKENACVERIPEGRYLVKSTFNQFKQETPLEVVEEELTKINIVMGQTGKVEITASEEEGGKWVEANHFIYKADDEEGDYIEACTSYKKQACVERIPVGNYLIKSTFNQFKQETPLEVIAGKTAKIKIAMGQTGKVEITASEEEGGKWVEANHFIFKADDDEGDYIEACTSYKKQACVEQIPVGSYLIKSTFNQFKQETPLEIIAGKTVKIKVVMGQTGKVEITASEEEGGKWVQANHFIYKADDVEGSYIAGCTSRKKQACLEQIPVGEYLIKSTFNQFKQETPLEVIAGKTAKIKVVMGQTGKVEITASEEEGGKWIQANHFIYKADDVEGSYIASCTSRKKQPCLEQIPVGKYLIKSTFKKFKKETSLDVKAGKTNKVQISFAPFHLTIQGANPCAEVLHEVISSEGQTVVEKRAIAKDGVDFVLPAGRYTIESTLGGDTLKTKISIGGDSPTKNTSINFGREATANTVQGVWKTSQGNAELSLEGAQVTGTYGSDSGTINGEMTYPKRFEGFWTEARSNTKCSTSKQGSDYWGKIRWEFDDSMCSFKGSWSYCNKKPNGNWTGQYLKPLVAPVVQEDTPEELMKADTQQEAPQAITQEKPKIPEGLEAMFGKPSGQVNPANNGSEPSSMTPEEEQKKAMADIGKMFGAVKKMKNKPLEAYKNSIVASLPTLKMVKSCFEIAADLAQAQICEGMEELALKKAQAAMKETMGMEPSKVNKLIKHSEWNTEIKQTAIEKTASDIQKMETTLVCIDKGADFSQLNKCVDNDGEFVAKKSQANQMEDLLKAFGAMQKQANQIQVNKRPQATKPAKKPSTSNGFDDEMSMDDLKMFSD